MGRLLIALGGALALTLFATEGDGARRHAGADRLPGQLRGLPHGGQQWPLDDWTKPLGYCWPSRRLSGGFCLLTCDAARERYVDQRSAVSIHTGASALGAGHAHAVRGAAQSATSRRTRCLPRLTARAERALILWRRRFGDELVEASVQDGPAPAPTHIFEASGFCRQSAFRDCTPRPAGSRRHPTLKSACFKKQGPQRGSDIPGRRALEAITCHAAGVVSVRTTQARHHYGDRRCGVFARGGAGLLLRRRRHRKTNTRRHRRCRRADGRACIQHRRRRLHD